ncbi:putative RNA-directed DNA polymerase [Helianthus annuus]|nr:putative RNA-directed DNA polymerase [Helianthus annuus]
MLSRLTSIHEWLLCDSRRQLDFMVIEASATISLALISQSSAEAKYRGVVIAVAEATWIQNLLLELHISLRHASVVFCDNVLAIYVIENHVQHQRTGTKHIEIDIHFVREKGQC